MRKKRLAAIKDPHTPMPDRNVGDNATIRLGGTTLELRYLGLNHSDSTLVMRLPREKIIFLVDTIPVGSMPGRGMIDFYPLETEAFMKRVLAMDWERLIPGHPGAPNDRLGTKKDAEDHPQTVSGGLGRAAEAGAARANAGSRPRRSSSSKAMRTGRAMPAACLSSPDAIAGCGAAALDLIATVSSRPRIGSILRSFPRPTARGRKAGIQCKKNWVPAFAGTSGR